jgi:release factor glutamine methyltransferase
MDIAQALAAARALGVDRLDAQWLLSHHLQRPRPWLLAHDEHPLPAAIAELVTTQLARRAAGEPLAYLLGEREFCGLALQVNPAVLIPRPETELLVDWALEVLAAAPATTVVDLGTGSGAIALALASRRPDLAVTATDASAEALAVAGGNAQRLGLAVSFVHGPWWAPLAGQRFGLAVSNPPYVAEGDPHLAALAHEPTSALTAGPDGLADLQAIIAGAPRHLLQGAWLLLEHGHDQGAAVRDLLQQAGFADAQTRCDLAGLDRCTGGRWSSPALAGE